MIQNLAAQLPNVFFMLTALAYVLGFYFVFAGIMKLKHVGESRSMMSPEHGIKAPIIFLIVGAMLIYLPSTIQVGMSTFWTTPNPYGYLEQQQQWTSLINDCFLVVQLVGVIAFIRGLVILSTLSHSGGHQNAFGKGITHIIGGILCINMYQFVQVVMNTLGLSFS
jgi:intracellular multiplication protein IcmC